MFRARFLLCCHIFQHHLEYENLQRGGFGKERPEIRFLRMWMSWGQPGTNMGSAGMSWFMFDDVWRWKPTTTKLARNEHSLFLRLMRNRKSLPNNSWKIRCSTVYDKWNFDARFTTCCCSQRCLWCVHACNRPDSWLPALMSLKLIRCRKFCFAFAAES